MNGYLQFILLSIVFLQIYTQIENSRNYRGPDYSKDIDDTIKRYSREASQQISDIKQKIFEKRTEHFMTIKLLALLINSSKTYHNILCR